MLRASLFALFVLCWTSNTVCFNIDTTIFHQYTSVAGSYFGYATALHKENTNLWVIVGAPLSSSTGTKIAFQNGAAFRCNADPTKPPTCTNLAIDDVDATFRENKTTQWLGATVVSNGPDLPVVVGAPRYMDNINGFWLHGRCHVLNPNLSRRGNPFNPCISRRQGNVQYGYCQAGLAAEFSKTTTPFLITDLIGLGQGTGGLAVINANLISDAYVETTNSRLVPNDFMGYAIAWGNFSGSQFGDAVGGAPRGDDLLGKVFIYTLNSVLPITANIPNPDAQIGSYFGSALCAIDLNKDGWSDLLIGAPFHSTIQEEGRVYLYINNGQGALNLISRRLEPDSNVAARFGTSMAAIGDINQDSHPDVAIGAPFGGSDGRGAVYIYFGSSEGLANNFQPVQVLTPSDFSLGLQSFGSSITSGVDVDSNGYPDFAIGSYQSDSVLLVRSRPVIKVSAAIILNTTNVPIDLTEFSCLAPDGVKYACVSARVCLTYSGESAPLKLNLTYTLTFDSQVAGERRAMLVAQDGTHSHTSSRDFPMDILQPSCDNFIVYINTATKDHLTPITLSALYVLKNPAPGCTPPPCPILDFFTSTTFSSQISYLRDCGSDNLCNSDLSLSGFISLPGGVTEYVYGQEDSLTLNIVTKNLGENAFLSSMRVIFPNDIDAIGVEFQNQSNPFWDKEEHNSTHDRLVFDLPSPFSFNRELVILVKLAPKTTRPSSAIMSFLVTATTLSSDTNMANNNLTLAIGTGMLACVHVTGSVAPQQVFYNDNSTSSAPIVKETEIGEQVDFSFLIKNDGPSQLSEVDINVKMTTQKDSEHILYLLSATVDGTTACDVKLDPRNFTAQTGNDTSSSSRKRRAIEVLDCSKASCTNFRCKLGQMAKSQTATLQIRGRVWEKTFNKMGKDTFNLTTVFNLVLTNTDASLLRVPPQCRDGRGEQTVHVTVISQEQSSQSTTESVDWWIILLSIVGGLLLIALGVFILYKAGFFKRKTRAKYISSPADNAGVDE